MANALQSGSGPRRKKKNAKGPPNQALQKPTPRKKRKATRNKATSRYY